ncbi:MAG: Sec-independent protein translocase protein TatB [Hyphomonadaceae bacterium]|nr:Sec-independent protein translocase protein TatB [Hyphomonadaceae bacterium]
MSEMVLIGLLALLVVGPKDLPLLMRKAGRFMNKVRMMASEFRASFDDLARQAELDELRKEVEALRTGSGLQDIHEELKKPAAPAMAPPSPELLAQKQAILAKEAVSAETIGAGAPLVEPVSVGAAPDVVMPAKPKRRRVTKPAAPKPASSKAAS